MSRVVPAPDERSAPFWEAAAEHRLVLARCERCGRISHPPDVVCGHCQDHSGAIRFEAVGTGATVRSWITVHQSFLPGFEDLVPYVIVDASLDVDADVRLLGRLIDGTEAPLSVGTRVQVVFEDLAPGIAVPAFTLGTP